jgi:hypothetical protein
LIVEPEVDLQMVVARGDATAAFKTLPMEFRDKDGDEIGQVVLVSFDGKNTIADVVLNEKGLEKYSEKGDHDGLL